MIRAAIYQNQRREYAGFRIEGHAGYGEEGQDLVCAAVSVLVINTVNALEEYTADHILTESAEAGGVIALRFEGGISHDAELLLKTMVLGLKSMADNENYKEYIEVTFEEV